MKLEIKFTDLRKILKLIENNEINELVKKILDDLEGRQTELNKDLVNNVSQDNKYIEKKLHEMVAKIANTHAAIDSVNADKFSKDRAISILNCLDKQLDTFRKTLHDLSLQPSLPSEGDWREHRLRLEQKILLTGPLADRFRKTLQQIAHIAASKKYVPPNGVFICYAWPDEKDEQDKHLNWVQPFLIGLRQHLKDAGIYTTRLDITDNLPGGNIYEYMKQARSSEFVLLIGTPTLLRKHDKGTSAVCTELISINRKREQDRKENKYRVFGMLISGDYRESFPPHYELYTTVNDWVGGQKSYWEQLQWLLRALYEVGQAPLFNDTFTQFLHESTADEQIVLKDGLAETAVKKHLEEECRTREYKAQAHDKASGAVLKKSPILSASTETVPVQPSSGNKSASPMNTLPNLLKPLYQRYCTRRNNDSELNQALAYYVLPECVLSQNPNDRNALHKDLNSKVMQIIKDGRKSPIILIQGDSGAGKSLYLNWLEETLWKTVGLPRAVIPIFIELKSFELGDKKLDNSQRNFFELFLTSSPLNYTREQVNVLRENFRFIILFDGFDEMRGTPFNIYQNNHLMDWNVFVIITCRRQYLDGYPRYKDWFVYKPGEYSHELTIASFHRKQIEIYLGHYQENNILPADWDQTTYLNKLRELIDIDDIGSSPLLLHMVVRAILTLVKRKEEKRATLLPTSITRADIYAIFIQDWFDRETHRLQSLKGEAFSLYQNLPPREAFEMFCEDVAWEMFQSTLSEVAYHASNSRPHRYAKTRSPSETNVWEQFFSDSNPEVIETRAGCPLRCHQHVYSFHHKSFLEYFIAKGLYNDLSLGEEDERRFQDALHSLAITRWNVKYLTNEPAIIDFLAQIVQSHPRVLERLFEAVIASRDNPLLAIAASNAMSVLVRANFCLSHRDLSRIHIPNALLEGIIADHANFRGANLSHTTLSRAWLRGADLRCCQLNEVYFSKERADLFVDNSVHEGVYDIIFFKECKDIVVVLVHQMYQYDDNLDLLRSKYIGSYLRNTNAAFSKNGLHFALIDSLNTIKIMNVNTAQCEHQFQSNTDGITCVSLSADYHFVAASGHSSLIHIWNIATGKLEYTFCGHSNWVTNITFSTDCLWLASGGWDKTIRIWNMKTGLCQYTLNGHTSSITGISFSSDGRQLVSTSYDNTACVWDIISGQREHTLTGHTHVITSASFSDDNRYLVTGSWDKCVKVWDITSGNNIGMLFIGYEVTIVKTYDINTIVVGCRNDIVQLWRRNQLTNQWYLHRNTYRQDLHLNDCKLDTKAFYSLPQVSRAVLREKLIEVDTTTCDAKQLISISQNTGSPLHNNIKATPPSQKDTNHVSISQKAPRASL